MNHSDTILGKIVKAPTKYNPKILQPIARYNTRKNFAHLINHINSGWDEWINYELQWCNNNGCPQIAILLISIPYESQFIIESKSLKLYFNSLNFHKFNDKDSLLATIKSDLETTIQFELNLKLYSPTEWAQQFPKICFNNEYNIDNTINKYNEVTHVDNGFLTTSNQKNNEFLFSNNFRSNCPVTGQPDWATITIHYDGNSIDKEGLYLYLLSYRKHQGFHEQCIERIFTDIFYKCKPNNLEVRGYFTRRGGLDINPIRSTKSHVQPPLLKLQSRQ